MRIEDGDLLTVGLALLAVAVGFWMAGDGRAAMVTAGWGALCSLAAVYWEDLR